MRYAVFAGDDYYPSGGMRDLKGRFSTIEEAHEEATRAEAAYGGGTRPVHDWWHIVDLETFEQLESYTSW